jgi:Alpha/beta hydrolase family
VEAIGTRRDLVVVAQSFGGFTAPLVADRLPVERLVLVAGMVPLPGEAPDDWSEHTGFAEALREQAERDGGLTGPRGPIRLLLPRRAPRAGRRGAEQDTAAVVDPGPCAWPLETWPDVLTRFVLCTEDRFFPADFLRWVVAERLDIVPDEIAAGHCVALSRPKELAAMLEGYAAQK